MRILLLQLDGKTPNLALMHIAAHHRRNGDDVELRRITHTNQIEDGFWDHFDRRYASLIFTKTRPVAERLHSIDPSAIIGGTGWDRRLTLADVGIRDDGRPDYADYPDWPHSIGFTQRGCRLKCGFCVVPEKEGAAREVASVWDIWRGDPYPRNLLLLDNDFFGVTAWRNRIEEINAGGFKVCWNQGFNVRLIGDEEAAAIASTHYCDDQFKERRLYTAWDSRKDEARLFRNLESLARYGVRPDDILIYMLIGYWAGETDADWEYRRAKLREFGALPYPMPFNRTRLEMGFQRFCVTRADLKVSWPEYKAARCRPEKMKRDDTPRLFPLEMSG